MRICQEVRPTKRLLSTLQKKLLSRRINRRLSLKRTILKTKILANSLKKHLKTAISKTTFRGSHLWPQISSWDSLWTIAWIRRIASCWWMKTARSWKLVLRDLRARAPTHRLKKRDKIWKWSKMMPMEKLCRYQQRNSSSRTLNIWSSTTKSLLIHTPTMKLQLKPNIIVMCHPSPGQPWALAAKTKRRDLRTSKCGFASSARERKFK